MLWGHFELGHSIDSPRQRLGIIDGIKRTALAERKREASALASGLE